MLESFAIGLHAVMTPLCILMMFFGVAVGIVFGAIPGLSATMALALFLPITYSLDVITGVVLLVALYIGGISGGLISAILTRIPGTPSSIATCFDGHPLMQKGQGVKALGVGVVFSFLGTIFSVVILIFLAPPLARVAIQFGSFEYFAVAIFSLTMMVVLSGDNIIKGLISGVMGCMLATIGLDTLAAMKRYTFGSPHLMNGFNILSVLIGMFACTEILNAAAKARTEKNAVTQQVSLKGVKGFGFTMEEFFSQKWNALIAACIGTAIGILPGIGGGTSNVLAYGVIKNRSKYPEKFGTGVIDGVVASETANNASIGGALVPLLALGIPGDSVTAMLLGGLTLKGISPGPMMFTTNVDIVYSIFLTVIFASLIMLFMEFYGLRVFTALLKIPKYYLLPGIFVFCVVGAFGIRNNAFDVWAAIGFGFLGFIFSKLEIPASPFILGFIIGPMMETHLRRGLMISHGSMKPFFTYPIAAVFLIAAMLVLVFSAVKQIRRQNSSNTKAQ